MLYKPREYQLDFLNAMEDQGLKRACLVWHRRAGKDTTSFAFLAKKAMKEVGIYYYVFPSLKQGRKIFWDGKSGAETDHKKFMDLMIDPKWLWPDPQKGVNNTEMKIRLRHPNNPNREGSIIQVVGTKGDEADSIVGTNPRGLLFSEYSIQSPIVWEVMSPILAENGGWAIFVYTPRGRNHGYSLFKNAQQSSDWYTSLLTVKDTKRLNGFPVIDEAYIEGERLLGKREEFIKREYYCSFEGAVDGAIYGEEIEFMYADGRIRPGLYDSARPCSAAFDIGRDMTAIGIFQRYDQEFQMVDYFQQSNKSLEYFARYLNTKSIQMGYRLKNFYFPHDIMHHEYTYGKSRYREAIKLGLHPITAVPKMPLDDGIDAVRRQLKFLSIDEKRCEKFIHSFVSYENETDDETMEILANKVGPKWATHGCDMLRTYCCASHAPSETEFMKLPTEVRNDYDPFATRSFAGDSRDFQGTPSQVIQQGFG